jgi:hypothetical protein
VAFDETEVSDGVAWVLDWLEKERHTVSVPSWVPRGHELSHDRRAAVSSKIRAVVVAEMPTATLEERLGPEVLAVKVLGSESRDKAELLLAKLRAETLEDAAAVTKPKYWGVERWEAKGGSPSIVPVDPTLDAEEFKDVSDKFHSLASGDRSRCVRITVRCTSLHFIACSLSTRPCRVWFCSRKKRHELVARGLGIRLLGSPSSMWSAWRTRHSFGATIISK